MDEFKLELDLRPNGKLETFNSLDEVQEWLRKEKEFWNWSTNVRERNPDLYRYLNHFIGKLDDLLHITNEAIKLKEDENYFQRLMDDLKKSFEGYYKKGLIHSSDPRAKHVKEMTSRDPIQAIYMLRYFVEKNFDYINNRLDPRQFEGFVGACLFDWNIKGADKAYVESLSEVRNLWSDHLKKSQQELDKTINDYNQQLIHFDEHLKNQKNKFQNFLDEINRQGNELIDKTKKKFTEIEEMYEKNLALHSSITYWKDKAKGHSWWGVGLTVALIIAFWIVGTWLFESIRQVVGNETLQTIHVWKLGLVILIATIGVWIIRVLIRLLLSHIHLASDAGERRTMLLTYLALLKDKALPDEENRTLILQALFRPTSTGIVKDDAAPPFMAEWLKRATGD